MFAVTASTSIDTLGQRILQAARLAVAMHMQQVATTAAAGIATGPSNTGNGRRQRVVIGRAGPQAGVGARAADHSTDGRLPILDGELPETEDDVSVSPDQNTSPAEGAD